MDILKPPPPVDDLYKKGGRQFSEKLILLTNNVTSSVIHMLDQVIDAILEIDNVNTILLEVSLPSGFSPTSGTTFPKNKSKTGTVSRLQNFKTPLTQKSLRQLYSNIYLTSNWVNSTMSSKPRDALLVDLFFWLTLTSITYSQYSRTSNTS